MMASPARQSAEIKIFTPRRRPSTTLVSRNVVIEKHRTSVRLEPDMWVGLKDICRRERASMHDICGMVARSKPTGTSLTAAIRVYVMSYFRSAATEDGHMKAGHGQGMILSGASLTPSTPVPQVVNPIQKRNSYMIGTRITPPVTTSALRHY